MTNPFTILEERLISIERRLETLSLPGDIQAPIEKPVNTKELAEFLGVTEQTVIRWRHKGRIPFFSVGSSVRYQKAKVVEALEKQKGGAK